MAITMYDPPRHGKYPLVETLLLFSFICEKGEAKLETTNVTLNDNRWHKVHLTRVDRTVTVTIDDGAASCK